MAAQLFFSCVEEIGQVSDIEVLTETAPDRRLPVALHVPGKAHARAEMSLRERRKGWTLRERRIS